MICGDCFPGLGVAGWKKGSCKWKIEIEKTYAYHEYIYVYLYVVVCPLLYWTADRCSPKLCFILFSGWFRFRCEDWEGATAVHLGIKGGHAEVCRFLMEARADPQEALDFGTSAQSNP